MVGALVALALVGAGCGDSDSNDAADDTSTTSTTARPAPTQAEATAALLTAADLPGGWKVEPSGEGDSDDAPCAQLRTLDEQKAAAEASIEFAPGENGPAVEHEVLLFADVATAERYMTQAEQAVAACKSFAQDDPDIGKLTGTFTVSSSPGLGDASLAASMSGKATGFTLSGEIIAVRKGRAISLLSQIAVQAGRAGSKLTAGLTQQLAAKATAKLQAVA
jgi:hypothetical protein